ncbi:DUF3857 domain-containing protein [Winogradskyella luteola]|uniref:DUF3857 domain-containing protein n=1 Tax=Winogradskyella luteola TaxID=2828330 RepID=A0A9X1F9V7_9FLAO|nr:DUF3857 domain-containing protein [Winogradskyella luteola]MBV7270197.1 DUF3857 domain-containing protein [Winogradskyella luteola]
MSVTKSDLELNHYSKDSTANALVIYDHGNSLVDEDTFWLRFQVKRKIKILKAEGLKEGEIEVRLYKGKSSKEKIRNIKAATYNLENKIIVKDVLKPSAIFEEENENYILVKFVLPKVKVGSVITYSYETQSRFMAKFQPWYFQGANPVLYSEYNTSIPGNYEYHIKLVGNIPLETNDQTVKKDCIYLNGGASANCAVAKYVMKNIPAYKPEGFTTTALNYIARIEYELSVIRRFNGSVERLTKTWDYVDKELKTDSDFGKQISKKSLIKNILPSGISSKDNQLEKAKAIRQFVVDNFKWNGKYERYDVSVKELLKEKVGSVFEINLLLENLLSSEGYKVYPILISTRNNGLPTKIFPVLTDFNYVILKTTIDGKDYYLDATEQYIPFGELPFRCLNQYGRLMDFENGSYWENITVKKHSLRHHKVNMTFQDDMFLGTIDSKFTGYHAHSLKRICTESPQAYLEQKVNANPNIKIKAHDISNFDKSEYDFQETIEIAMEPEIIGNKIYLNPFVFKFFKENPFKLQERTYPIDFGYKDIYTYAMKLELGENLSVTETPKDINHKLPNNSGSFTCSVKQLDNHLTIYFRIKFDNAIYVPQFYDYLKDFMSEIVETQNNALIVLEKQ